MSVFEEITDSVKSLGDKACHMFDKKEPTAAENAEKAEIAAEKADKAEDIIHLDETTPDVGERMDNFAYDAGDRIADGATYVVDHVAQGAHVVADVAHDVWDSAKHCLE